MIDNDNPVGSESKADINDDELMLSQVYWDALII